MVVRYIDTRPVSQSLPEPMCSHEEVDTRLLLHVKQATCAGYPEVVIKSPDTDVAVLAVAVSHAIPASVSLLTCIGSKLRRISITSASTKLGPEICHALPVFHAFTGCDTTIAFSGHGKKSAFMLLRSNCLSSIQAHAAFSDLGSSFQTLSAESIAALKKFVCMMYNVPHCSTVNDGRYQLFCTRSLQSSQLPPCRDAFLKHCSRANCQTGVWRRYLSPTPGDILPSHEEGRGQALVVLRCVL